MIHRKKRIVKVTFSDGKVRYKVEVKSLFFNIWDTDIVDTEDGYFEAIFSTYEKAVNFIDPNRKIINEEIIEIKE